MRIPNLSSGVLALTLTACPEDAMTTESTQGPTSAMTETSTATETATETTTATTGEASPCACFEDQGGGNFKLSCPGEVKAAIEGSCSGGACDYDGDAVTAALEFLATGQPGVVTWNLNRDPMNLPASPRVLPEMATCSNQQCDGGILIVTPDGLAFSQTVTYDDLLGSVTALTGGQLQPASYFSGCDGTVEQRFACVENAMIDRSFNCVDGANLDYQY